MRLVREIPAREWRGCLDALDRQANERPLSVGLSSSGEIHGDAGEALHIYTQAHPAFRELSRGQPWWERPLWP